jgi:hypothetical protein
MSLAHNANDINPKKIGFKKLNNVGRADHEDGVWVHKWEGNRWTKHGKDRIYFDDADGYIDVESGEVRNGAPVADVDVVTAEGDTYVQYWKGEHGDTGRATQLVAVLRR